ncbi:hypothetical protein GCM10022251_13030 [Phytohabitans flavus]|uniref:Uncharacterized protein n=1 Tax=Phytohabitans flavus TaxID=1076124 RepID=A0A6F8XJ87_9ACTN|nr:hypothetical protein Pflav_002820 [Phytohabitans flavus]
MVGKAAANAPARQSLLRGTGFRQKEGATMTMRFPPRRHTNSITPVPHRQPRHSSTVIVIVVVVQAITLALLGWEAPIVISIIGAPVALLRPARAFYPIHA